METRHLYHDGLQAFYYVHYSGHAALFSRRSRAGKSTPVRFLPRPATPVTGSLAAFARGLRDYNQPTFNILHHEN